jgi:hypothetical protein
MRYGGREVQ